MGGHILRGTTNRPREWAVHKLYTAMQFPAHKVWISEPDSYVDLYEPAPHDQFEPRPVVGDVVVIGAAPTSDQWLAVVVEVYGKGSRYDDVYALRGCGYTTIVNWSNCGLRVLNRQWVKDNSRFFWTDAEWQFEDKIERAHKLVGHDTNEFRKIEPVFNGEDATLSYRRKWNTFDEDGITIALPGWRKMTLKALKAAVIGVGDLFEQNLHSKAPPVIPPTNQKLSMALLG